MNLYDIINITDCIHGTISINYIEKELISTPLFNRLHRILQSSMAYLTFPSNKTTRFEHSLGTMHLAGKMFYYSILNAEEAVIDSFFSIIDNYINHWIQNEARASFYTDYISNNFLKGTGRIINHRNISEINGSLYNRYLPSNLKPTNRFAYIITFQAVRIAALLHDIGHFPYSHTVERAINELYQTITTKAEKNTSEIQFIESINNIYNEYGQHEFHEIISRKITSTILKNTERELFHRIIEKNEENDLNKCIISLSFYFSKFILTDHDDFFTDIHSIIDGVIDADRLDYICRDTYNSGTRNDIINYDRLINTMRIVCHYNDHFNKSSYYFAFQAKLVRDLEDVLNRRWRICCDIHKHHRVCKSEILMVNVINNLAKLHFEESISDFRQCLACNTCDKKHECAKQQIDHMLLNEDISGLWKSIELLNEPHSETLEYMFIQLDDSWFDTILKKEGYSRFEWPLSEEMISQMQNPLQVQLDEIISNKKHYTSFIKRTVDFVDYDVEIINEFFKNENYVIVQKELNNLIDIMNPKSIQYTNLQLIQHFFSEVSELYRSIYTSTEKPLIDLYPPKYGFFFNSIYELLCDLYVIPAFLKPINNKIERTLESCVKSIDTQILDCIITLVNVKTGYNSQRPIQLIDTSNNLVPMSRISVEESSLKKERKFLPGFYIYISTKIPIERIRDSLCIKIRNVIGRETSHILLELVEQELVKCKEELTKIQCS